MRSVIHHCWECGAHVTTEFVEGRDRKICTACGTILYENPAPTTAALITNAENKLLLVKRARNPEKGSWCLPGGFLEIGESPEQGVLRELKEETNLEGSVEYLVGLAPSMHGHWGDVVVIGFAVQVNGGAIEPGDDAEAAQYFSFDALPQLAFQTHRRLINLFRDSDRL